jgi:HSP20 family protein
MYKRYRLPSIWREMDQLQQEMNRLFEDAVGKRTIGSPTYPAINLWANEEGQLIKAEMPGLVAEDFQVDVTADTLTISGSRVDKAISENSRYHRQERGSGEFMRTIQLPFMVDTESVNASFKNGLLTIKLQRAEADKPKKIAVKSE